MLIKFLKEIQYITYYAKNKHGWRFFLSPLEWMDEPELIGAREWYVCNWITRRHWETFAYWSYSEHIRYNIDLLSHQMPSIQIVNFSNKYLFSSPKNTHTLNSFPHSLCIKKCTRAPHVLDFIDKWLRKCVLKNLYIRYFHFRARSAALSQPIEKPKVAFFIWALFLPNQLGPVFRQKLPTSCVIHHKQYRFCISIYFWWRIHSKITLSINPPSCVRWDKRLSAVRDSLIEILWNHEHIYYI